MSFDIFSWLADQAVGGREEAIFGRKPQVADYKKVDAGEEASKAVKSNLANISGIQDLLERILPGYKDINAREGQNILSLLRGEIPSDVQDTVRRSSAFRALTGGYSGSPMSRALTARDFGRTSLDLMERGGNASQRWMQSTQNSVSPFIVTAPMQTEISGRNNLYDQATRQHQFNIDAAPEPAAAGKFNLQTALGMTAASFGLGSLTGGMGGGNRTQQPVQSDTSAYNAGLWNAGNSWGNWYG